jgi:hypothetical protein
VAVEAEGLAEGRRLFLERRAETEWSRIFRRESWPGRKAITCFF